MRRERVNYSLVLLSGGQSTRFKENKLLAHFSPTLSVVEASILPFLSLPNSYSLTSLVVVCPQGSTVERTIREKRVIKPLLSKGTEVITVSSGKNRFESAYNGVSLGEKALGSPDVICVSDAARPYCSEKLVEAVLCEAYKSGSAVPVVSPDDAYVTFGQDGEPLPNKPLSTYLIQTPQAFRAKSLIDAYRVAHEEGGGDELRDDSQVLAFSGKGSIHYIAGEYSNIKLTHPVDLIRTGIGEDLHRLELSERPFKIGGVEFESLYSPVAWGDGDSLMHALADAILGAFSFGDIGELFPPNQPQTKGISSTEIVKKVIEMCPRFRVVSIDTVVTLDEIFLKGYKKQIEESIARIIGCPVERVNVKAKSNEMPKGEGLMEYRASAIVCLQILMD